MFDKALTVRNERALNSITANIELPAAHQEALPEGDRQEGSPFASAKMYIFDNLVPCTVVLDLDETLIHCNETLTIPFDVKLNIKFPTGEKIDAGVNIRPHANYFLQELAKVCEVIVFTASHECYANVVLDYLDPKQELISHRLFRDHCWQTEEGVYVKDLRVLKNRSLDSVVLVDNAAYSYFFQLENGIPILPYYDDKNDKELSHLLKYLKELIVNSERTPIKESNQKYFRLQDYPRFEDIEMAVKELYIDGLGNLDE